MTNPEWTTDIMKPLTPEQAWRKASWLLAEYEKLHDMLSNAIEADQLEASHEILTEQLCRINDADIMDWTRP
jgi:hypothetical protein